MFFLLGYRKGIGFRGQPDRKDEVNTRVKKIKIYLRLPDEGNNYHRSGPEYSISLYQTGTRKF
jgi:hypothetical protein